MTRGTTNAFGCWRDERLGVYVGWTQLPGPGRRALPIMGPDRDVAVFLSGEDFSGPHEASRDESHLCDRWTREADFPSSLNGRFHGLASDARTGKVVLFNDRTGMHRLYYHETADAFFFGAEAKSLLAVLPECRHLDTRSLGEFLSCGCVLENRTLFDGVSVLPAGSRWVFESGRLASAGTYFQPSDWEDQTALSPQAYYEALFATLEARTRRYIDAAGRVGVSLTGGLDTRMLMALQAAPGSLPAFTFGSMFRDNQDVTVGRRVAQACGQAHEVIAVDQDFLARFDHYAERSIYLTDGCVEVTRAPDLYVNERLRTHLDVRVTGNYGGEVLRRVRAFKPMALVGGLFAPPIEERLHEAAATYRTVVGVHPLTFAVFKQGPWHFYGSLALEASQLVQRSPFMDGDLVRLAYRGPAAGFESDDLCTRVIRDGNAALLAIGTDRGRLGPRWSRSARHALLEFLFKAEYAYDYGMPQVVAGIDHRLAPLRLERLFLGRHKFYHYRTWYRRQLAPYVTDMLLASRSLERPYLNAPVVRRIVEGHTRGGYNYTRELHKLLTLELVHRLFIDRAP